MVRTVIGPYWTRLVVSQPKVANRVMLHEMLAPKMALLKWRSRTGQVGQVMDLWLREGP